jgi:hypothetical protein
MAKRRLDIGLHVITNGKHVSRGVLPWSEFIDRVTEAASKPKSAQRGIPSNMTNAANIESLWGKPIPKDRQCSFVHSRGDKKGKRCGAWAMKGATRCVRHGGYRQNPTHPATVRKLQDALAVDVSRRATASLRQTDPHARRAVEDALRASEIPLRAATILQGVEAYQMDDNGKAWRRFLEQAKKAKPSEGLRARRRQMAKQPKK